VDMYGMSYVIFLPFLMFILSANGPSL